ncbi:MAG: Lipoprotein [Candidatus Uhrbacteria bacterium GW2011_GWF2_41_16]|uniref:Lipoprotein n=2 Tax=Candidatus Uhriibacteriota TaxID=1752732 RepID=A0A0G0VDS6_9BACT|nr:MAG: Lipoprotein [Candidatus Uhrbacteria bacterium GW2011_GWC2_41_11]KKR97811.1 MAG: Lipoprotein [Candidatus Uhrbacteria bacterium GW2011_GWF2_41_16]
MKQHACPAARFVSKPLLFIFIRLIRWVGVPIYRVYFWIKRFFSKLYLPTKNRLLYLVSNRYVFHAAVIGIVAVTTSSNFQGSEVRAETFGEKSLLFSIVSQEDLATVEEIKAKEGFVPIKTNYSEMYALSPSDTADLDLIDEDYVNFLGGNGFLTSSIGAESPVSSSRTETEIYVVQDGDTLSTIADRYGLNLSSVLWANELTFKSTIKPKQELAIPPVDGVLYTVKNGDTIQSIAKKYSAESEQIVAFNKLTNANTLKIGQNLIIPGGEPPKIVPVRRTAPLTKLFVSPSSNDSVGKKASASDGGWVWPTDWHVITQYYGWKHVGLDLDGDYNTKNYAARAGTITRASWYSGYGLCVDIDHGDGYKTRYGHFSKIFVEVGQQVAAGEALGMTGTTGYSTGTHLHFEVFENGKRRNPLEFVR